MTDIISNIKIQQKPSYNKSRRVCLQQNQNTATSTNNTTKQVLSSFLVSNNNIASINHCLPSPLSSLIKLVHHIAAVPKSSLKTQPGVVTKSVRFNMPLVYILHFYTPPSLEEEEEEYYDDNDDEDDYKEEEKENELEDAFLELFSKRLTTTSSTDFDSNLFHPTIQQNILDSTSTNKLNLVLLDWPSTHPTKRFISKMVSLENLSWDNTRSIVKGRVLVHNLAFEKKVAIRISFNHWLTWMDVDATYKESSDGNALDRFAFELSAVHINQNSHCSLAVRYQVDSSEFWDNNSGNNFNMQWISSSSCGNRIGEQEENIKSMNFMMVRENKVIAIPLYQQGQSTTTTTTTIGSQENNRKKEGYYITLSKNQSSNYYITTPPGINEQSLFTSSTTQQKISAHFQLYLERKRHSEDRQKETSFTAVNSIVMSMNPPISSLSPTAEMNSFF